MATLNQEEKKESQFFRYFIVLDFEATCDKNQNASLKIQEIIEWPAMVIDIKSKKIMKIKFHYYIKPKIHRKLTPFCTELTGITQKTIDKSADITQVVKLFIKFCEKNKFTANNSCIITHGDWDLQKMWPIQKYSNNKLQDIKLFKSWINIKKYYQKHYTKKWDKNTDLMSILKKLGIKHIGRHHSGIDDVENICNIVLYMLKDKSKNIEWKYTTINYDDKSIKKMVDDALKGKKVEWKKKAGDWNCSNCDYLNFAYRELCGSCSIGKRPSSKGRLFGDWICPTCKDYCFARMNKCRKCHTKKPVNENKNKNKKQDESIIKSKLLKNDWSCNKCNYHNFAYRKTCNACDEKKPINNNNNIQNENEQPLMPGDWICKECDYHNFASRIICNSCGKKKSNENKKKNNNDADDNDDKKENNNNAKNNDNNNNNNNNNKNEDEEPVMEDDWIKI